MCRFRAGNFEKARSVLLLGSQLPDVISIHEDNIDREVQVIQHEYKKKLRSRGDISNTSDDEGAGAAVQDRDANLWKRPSIYERSPVWPKDK